MFCLKKTVYILLCLRLIQCLNEMNKQSWTNIVDKLTELNKHRCFFECCTTDFLKFYRTTVEIWFLSGRLRACN